MIAIGVITFSCTNKLKLIHEPLSIPNQCIFEKFTEEEKTSMIEDVGKKIYRNQQNCRIRQDRIDALIKNHNDAHSGVK